MSDRVDLSILVGLMFALAVSFTSSAEPLSMPKQHQVIISAFEFVPSELKVLSGDTVTWVNKDIVPHNIAINTIQKALSPELATGDKFVYKVSTSLSYICGFHPSMKGKLIVSDE